MKKFNVHLVFPSEMEAVFGRVAIPDFIDPDNPPQRGDLLRFKGKTFAIQARLWDLDITPPTLVLKLAAQEVQQGSPKTPM